ncbi:MAG: 50S ribosomal protein L25, partial [Myxococcales bacterium]
MANIELSATVREKGGKGNARKMRAQKLIPGVLYGPTVEKPLNIAVDPIALRKALATPKKLNTILTLKLDRGGDRQVMLKDYQTDVIKHDLLHADFYEVRLDQPVKVRVPLAFVGIPAGAADGGVLQTLRRELELLALPNAIPDQIEVDVAPLKIGQSLHLKDLKLPEG